MSRRLIVEADGGSRGNPGPAGYGALVRDGDTGSVLARRNGYLGRTTNNVAEYSGLIAGLKAVDALDPSASVEVRMDSKLVVEQMSGRWKIKHPVLAPLAQEAMAVARRLGTVRYSWMPRAQNTAADALANEAMDARASTYDHLDDDTQAPDVPTAQPELPGTGWSAPAGEPTTLLLLRHGQTGMSVDRRFSGSSDPALTELGLAQAGAAARRLVARGGITAVVSSPLGRAMATARAVGTETGLRVTPDSGWRETDFGAWEGLTFGEVRERDPEALAAWLADPAQSPPGGESFDTVTERVAAARDAVVAAYPGQTVVVVSHVTPIKVVARLALDAPPGALYRMHLDLCSLTVVDIHPDGPAVLRGLNLI